MKIQLEIDKFKNSELKINPQTTYFIKEKTWDRTLYSFYINGELEGSSSSPYTILKFLNTRGLKFSKVLGENEKWLLSELKSGFLKELKDKLKKDLQIINKITGEKVSMSHFFSNEKKGHKQKVKIVKIVR